MSFWEINFFSVVNLPRKNKSLSGPFYQKKVRWGKIGVSKSSCFLNLIMLKEYLKSLQKCKFPMWTNRDAGSFDLQWDPGINTFNSWKYFLHLLEFSLTFLATSPWHVCWFCLSFLLNFSVTKGSNPFLDGFSVSLTPLMISFAPWLLNCPYADDSQSYILSLVFP